MSRRIRPTKSDLLPFSAERTAALQSKLKRKKNTTPTNQLTDDVRNYIAKRGGYSIRCNVAGFYHEDVGYIRGSSTVGTPDLIAIIGGRFVGIEIKVGRDIQSIEQKEVQREIEAAGGVYLLVSDFGCFKVVFDSIVDGPA